MPPSDRETEQPDARPCDGPAVTPPDHPSGIRVAGPPERSAEGFQVVPPPPLAGPQATAGRFSHEQLGGQLHPAAIGVWSAAQLGALVIIFILNPLSLIVALPFMALLVSVSVVRWSRFRWQLSDGTLVIEQGLINRQRRVIPVERIQSVDLVRRLSHRLFGVVSVHVEAIGAGETEGQLDALSPRKADRLRRALLASRAAARGDATPEDMSPVADEDPGELLASAAPRTLVLAGLTEANGTLIAGLLGLGWQFFGDRIDELAERLPALLGGNVVVMITVVVIMVAVALLVAAQLLAFWGFTLHRSGGELRVRRGLLEQRFDTIPLRRVQALRIEENLPRRLLGYAAVKADVAGKPGGGSGGTDTLLPMGSASDARALVDAVLDMPGVGDAELTAMPKRARARRRVRATVAVVAPALVLGIYDPRGLALLLLLVPAYAAADASYRALGHAELPGILVMRSGWWVRRTAFVPADRLQTLAVTATYFQRRRRLATLVLGIARSPGLWGGPQMIDLDAEVATDISEELAPIASRPDRRAPATALSTAAVHEPEQVRDPAT
jgi:putative membrane protein